jgi:hypothetical protein
LVLTIEVDQLWWPAHLIALIGWAFLLFGSQDSGLPVRIARLVAGGLSFVYLALFLVNASDAGGLALDYSPSGVTAFFTDPGLRMLGWVHYLAFDLLVGSWEAEEGHKSGISRPVLSVCLLLTLMLGPAGLVAFLLCQKLKAGRSVR